LTGSAFILGNSPLLPVADLDCLDRCFTVGVNRIVEVYDPTVVMWVDSTVYRAVGKQIDASAALPVCDASVYQRQRHIGLRTWTGEGALTHETTPTTLCCNGNTGCMAARWALALGCETVYLVGMEARYAGGKTDFWGVNPRHRTVGDTQTLNVIAAELKRLKRDFPGRAIAIPDGVMLRECADVCEPVDQGDLRARIRALLSAGART